MLVGYCSSNEPQANDSALATLQTVKEDVAASDRPTRVSYKERESNP